MMQDNAMLIALLTIVLLLLCGTLQKPLKMDVWHICGWVQMQNGMCNPRALKVIQETAVVQAAAP